MVVQQGRAQEVKAATEVRPEVPFELVVALESWPVELQAAGTETVARTEEPQEAGMVACAEKVAL